MVIAWVYRVGVAPPCCILQIAGFVRTGLRDEIVTARQQKVDSTLIGVDVVEDKMTPRTSQRRSELCILMLQEL